MNSGRQVVISGVGVVSPLGDSLQSLNNNLVENNSSIVANNDEFETLGLMTRLSSPVPNFEANKLPRKLRRSMSRVSLMAVSSVSQAIGAAGLEEPELQNERTGVSYGSTMGGVSAIEDYFKCIKESGEISGVMSGTFMKIMSHTAAANIALSFSIPGRVIASCSACSASLQSIGFGYEAIKHGNLDRVICGGAEELHFAMVGVFDSLRSTSVKFNDSPSNTPRPFDKNRDGIVVGEGAGAFVLEEKEQAIKRGAHIYAEVAGFYTNNDAKHMTNPSTDGLYNSMKGSLDDAGVNASDIDYINAHGTATIQGDKAESHAINRLFGSCARVSSTKGHLGHLMGACGSIELAACLGMLDKDYLLPTRNLENIDEECGSLDYIMSEPRDHKSNYILKNSFAFGGINASLVLKRF